MSKTVMHPTITAVLTVYNKALFLADTIKSLRRQARDEHEVEYIFVDDASTDGSVALIRDLMADAPHVRILENPDNRGPSVRLNQGAAAASGKFLYLLDGDDIAIQGAMLGMMQLLCQEEADFIYGKTAKRLSDDADLFDLTVDPGARFVLSDRPLDRVLKGGFVRMALMCRRDLFLQAGGADERIFVQDESLPLRLAAKARRMVDWQTNVIAIPPPPTVGAKTEMAAGVEKISQNKSQLHHDAFLAYRHALDDIGKHAPDLAPKLFAKAVSAYWKHARRQPGATIFKPGFWRYLQTKSGNSRPRPDVLAWMQAELSKISGIRRM